MVFVGRRGQGLVGSCAGEKESTSSDKVATIHNQASQRAFLMPRPSLKQTGSFSH